MSGRPSVALAFRSAADLTGDQASLPSLTTRELEHVAGRQGLGRRLGRLAAKDAVARLRARRPGGAIEIRRGPHGEPLVTVDGASAATGVTISHDGDEAVALAYLERLGTGRVSFGVDLHHRRRPRPAGATEILRRRVLTSAELERRRWYPATEVEVAICAKEAVGKVLKPRHPTVRWYDVELDDHRADVGSVPETSVPALPAGWWRLLELDWRAPGRASGSGRCSMFVRGDALLAIAEGPS